MRILCLDCSLSRTGWAFGTPEQGVQASGGVEFPTPKKTDPAFRYFLFSQWLDNLITAMQPTLVVYEMGMQRGNAATEVSFGLVTRVKEQAAIHNVPYKSIYSTQLKLLVTGTGAADKCAMQAQASILWPTYDASKDPGGDEADALLMLQYWLDNPDGPPAKPKKPKKPKADKPPTKPKKGKPLLEVLAESEAQENAQSSAGFPVL